MDEVEFNQQELEEALNQINSLDSSQLSSTEATSLAIFSGIWLLFWLVFVVVTLVAMWKVFVKAGRQGWEAIVPIYNIYVLCQIVGRPGWWTLLMFIPFVNLVVTVLLAIDLAKSFGRDAVFGVVALWLFSIVGYLILAFGPDKYVGPSANGASAAPRTPATPPANPGPTPAA